LTLRRFARNPTKPHASIFEQFGVGVELAVAIPFPYASSLWSRPRAASSSVEPPTAVPTASSQLRNVWRKVCQPSRGMPTFAANGRKWRRRRMPA
jgi:hypothetical protein